jgi:hypothetical protein
MRILHSLRFRSAHPEKWVHRDLVPAALDNLGIPHREMRTFHSDKQLILEDKEPCLEKIEQEDREERSASAALIT